MFLQDSQSATILGIPVLVFSGLVTGLVGAGIALLSTYLQNKSHAKRQKELLDEQFRQQEARLKHEAEQRKLEREMTMRRDIFLSGIDSVGKMYQFLMSFSNINNTAESRENILSGAAPALNKVAVIANFNTIEALEKINNFYNKSFPILLEKRIELDNEIQYKTNLETAIQNILQRNQQLINSLSPENKALNNELINLINSEVQKNFGDIKENEKLIEELKHKTIDQMLELLNLCFQTSSEFQKLGADAILHIRRELDFPIDELKYKALMEKSAEIGTAHITDWYKNIIEKHRHEL